jgi:hypothetical protein
MVYIPNNVLQQYAGKYKTSDNDDFLKIICDNGDLLIEYDNYKQLLIPKTDSTFVPFEWASVQFNFNKNKNDKPTELLIISEKGEFPYIKID